MKAELVLIKSGNPVVSPETVQELEWLLKEARAGALTGIAYTSLHYGGKVTVNAVGRARLIPMFTMGAVDTLKTFVSNLVR